jgi:hypothetical protein
MDMDASKDIDMDKARGMNTDMDTGMDTNVWAQCVDEAVNVKLYI